MIFSDLRKRKKMFYSIFLVFCRSEGVERERLCRKAVENADTRATNQRCLYPPRERLVTYRKAAGGVGTAGEQARAKRGVCDTDGTSGRNRREADARTQGRRQPTEADEGSGLGRRKPTTSNHALRTVTTFNNY